MISSRMLHLYIPYPESIDPYYSFPVSQHLRSSQSLDPWWSLDVTSLHPETLLSTARTVPTAVTLCLLAHCTIYRSYTPYLYYSTWLLSCQWLSCISRVWHLETSRLETSRILGPSISHILSGSQHAHILSPSISTSITHSTTRSTPLCAPVHRAHSVCAHSPCYVCSLYALHVSCIQHPGYPGTSTLSIYPSLDLSILDPSIPRSIHPSIYRSSICPSLLHDPILCHHAPFLALHTARHVVLPSVLLYTVSIVRVRTPFAPCALILLISSDPDS